MLRKRLPTRGVRMQGWRRMRTQQHRRCRSWRLCSARAGRRKAHTPAHAWLCFALQVRPEPAWLQQLHMHAADALIAATIHASHACSSSAFPARSWDGLPETWALGPMLWVGRGAGVSAGRAHLGAGLVYGHDGRAALPRQVLDGADAEERGRRVQACRYGSSYIDTLHRCVVSTGGMEVRVSGTVHARPGFAAAGATQSTLARCR